MGKVDCFSSSALIDVRVYKPSHMILGERFDKMSLSVSQEIAVKKVIFNNVTIYRLNLVSI